MPHLAPYSASKFALVGLSEALGVELAREGIRVTTVSPGLLRTGSHVNAKFKGQHAKEFDWFSTSDNFPLDSVGAESAARQIVEACRRGQRVLSFPLTTRAAEIGQAVFPNLTARVLELVNRWVLPAPGHGSRRRRTPAGQGEPLAGDDARVENGSGGQGGGGQQRGLTPLIRREADQEVALGDHTFGGTTESRWKTKVLRRRPRQFPKRRR